MTTMPSRSLAAGVLLALLLALQPAQAQPDKTPRKLIEDLGLQVRQILESAKPDRTPEDAERAVAEQITALSRSAPGHLSLTAPDDRGRTPLMLAVSGAYPLVVQALLADPGVKLQVNLPDAEGATAWMTANFAPTLTLVACQPGNLTVERSQLMPPYLRRMAHLLKAKGAAVGAIVRMLQEAGAEPNAEEARRVWLARCPNTTAELRSALASAELQPTLINAAVTSQRAFNKAARESLSKLPARPPQGMRFVAEPAAMPDGVRISPLLSVHQMNCAHMAFLRLPEMLEWRGEMLLKAIVQTRAGVVEVADFELLSGKGHPQVVDIFRNAILGALAAYQCSGDQVFEQEFQFNVN